MKSIYHVAKLFLLLGTGIFMSCQDMNDVHEEYIKDGELIYTNKVDSLTTMSGRNRLKINGYLTGAFNVDEIVVSWENGAKERVFPYTKSEGDTDFLELILAELPEDTYEFSVVSRDSEGNISVPSTIFGTAYGEKYRSNLEARTVNVISYDGNTAQLTLGISTEYQRATEFRFTDTQNAVTTVSVPNGESLALLENISMDKPITYRTFYVPTTAREGVETAIDQFDSDWQTLNVPKIGAILNTVELSPVLGGLLMEWSNPDAMDVKFTMAYIIDGEEKSQTFQSTEHIGKSIISGLEEGEQVIGVTITDVYGNKFGPKDFTVSPIPAVMLEKTGWTIIDFSTEEPGEGAPNGLATATIDGDVNTFWHTQWSGANPPYPHHFTVDMGAEKTIASFEVFRRQGNGNGQTKHQFLISNDGINWTDLGTYNMNPGINDGQIYAMNEAVTARYFRYMALEGPNYYAFLAEINIYGLE